MYILDEDPKDAGLAAASADVSVVAIAVDTELSHPARRKGKEPILALGTDMEERHLLINMVRARGVARRRFLAVGIFLSGIAITSKNLGDSMRKKWKIHGHLDSNHLIDSGLF
jgi:hypothetical protein